MLNHDHVYLTKFGIRILLEKLKYSSLKKIVIISLELLCCRKKTIKVEIRPIKFVTTKFILKIPLTIFIIDWHETEHD